MGSITAFTLSKEPSLPPDIYGVEMLPTAYSNSFEFWGSSPGWKEEIIVPLAEYIQKVIRFEVEILFQMIKRAREEGGSFTQRLLEYYEVDEIEEIISYLSRNLEIIPLLEEAPSRIKEITQRDDPLSLEVVYNPEDGEEMLFIIVWTELPPKELVRKELEIYKKWFIKATRNIYGKIGISLRSK